MESPLKWSIEPVGNELKVYMVGQMTEQVVFTELLERSEQKIAIDLSEVRRFTSSGIREWVLFITALSDDREVWLERCSVAMVHQLGMIANMAGNAKVRSVMVPYQCPVCDADQEEVLAIEEGVMPKIEHEVECKSCGDKTEFDDLPTSYLAFLKPLELE